MEKSEEKKKEKKYKVVLSENWGNNAGKIVYWDWGSVGYNLKSEETLGKGYWIKSYELYEK